MGKDPALIRQEIEETRAEMGDTVNALGYKADVKARAKDNVHGKVDAVSGRFTAVKEKIVGQAGTVAEQTPSGTELRDGAAAKFGGARDTLGQSIGDVKSSVGDGADMAKQNVRQAASVAQENPLGLAVGAIAVGFLGGLLIPSTRIEAEKIGPVADQLKGQAREAGQEAFEHGKAVASDAVHAAQDAARDASETVKGSTHEHADDLKSSVQRQATTSS